MMMRYKAGLETSDRILESTRAQIAENGLEGTTIKTICDGAGVLPGSFYNLFDSKEQAILTAVRVAIDAVDPDPTHEGKDTLEDLVAATCVLSKNKMPLQGSTFASLWRPHVTTRSCADGSSGITKDE